MFAFDGDYVFIEQTATYSLLDHRATKDNKKWGGARNPWNLTRTPGGSSGGDAALVAMRPVGDWYRRGGTPPWTGFLLWHCWIQTHIAEAQQEGRSPSEEGELIKMRWNVFLLTFLPAHLRPLLAIQT